MDEDLRTPVESSDETHATTGGAAAAGAVVAGAIGLTGGPLGAAIGALGGAIVGAAAERMMHSEDDHVPSTIYRVDTVDAVVPNTDTRSQPSGLREENTTTD